jgi:hypothetical protein
MKFDEFTRKHHLQYKGWSGVGDGWVPIIDLLFTDLRAIGFKGSQVEQIKEKFAGLRVYIAGETDEMRERISGRRRSVGEPVRSARTLAWLPCTRIVGVFRPCARTIRQRSERYRPPS